MLYPFYVCPFMVSTIMTAHSYVWILVNIEQIQFLHTIIFARSTLTFFQGRVQESYHPWDGVCCDNSCGKVFRFTFHSKEIINDKSCCDKHRSTRVNWLIYVLIFFMSAETSLCVSCARLFISMHISCQVLLRADCMYTHKPAFNLTKIFILKINMKVTIFNS